MTKICLKCGVSMEKHGSACDFENYCTGENPPLTEADIKQTRAHKIYGSGLPKCSNCGHPIKKLAGTCAVCDNCGLEIGGCSS